MESSLIALAKYRLECCQDAIEDAKIMYEHGRFQALVTEYFKNKGIYEVK